MMVTRRTSGAASRRFRDGGGRVGIGLVALAMVTGGVGVWAAAADPVDRNVVVDAHEPDVVESAAGGEEPGGSAVPAALDDPGEARSAPPEGSAPTVQPPLPEGTEDDADPPSVSEMPTSDAEVISVIEAAFEVTVGGKLMSDSELQDAVEVELPSVAVGPIRAELGAELLEVQTHGWAREGSPTFSEIEVIDDRSVDGKWLVLSACVDWSSVTYTELDGSPVPANPNPRARNIFTLVPGDDHWVIYDREFPNDPQC